MLSQKRFDSLHTGMTAIARKVYDGVPIAEGWPISRIINELSRQGFHHDVRLVGGCLNTLRDAGLITENKGHFRRVGVKEGAPKPTLVTEDTMKQADVFQLTLPVAQPEPSPVDKLGLLAARLVQIAGSLQDVAGVMSDVAIEFQSQLEDDQAKLTKLHQLQSLLKDLT